MEAEEIPQEVTLNICKVKKYILWSTEKCLEFVVYHTLFNKLRLVVFVQSTLNYNLEERLRDKQVSRTSQFKK